MTLEPSGPTFVQRVTAPEPPPAVLDTTYLGRLEFDKGYPTEATFSGCMTTWTSSGLRGVPAPHDGGGDVGLPPRLELDLGIGANALGVFRLDSTGCCSPATPRRSTASQCSTSRSTDPSSWTSRHACWGWPTTCGSDQATSASLDPTTAPAPQLFLPPHHDGADPDGVSTRALHGNPSRRSGGTATRTRPRRRPGPMRAVLLLPSRSRPHRPRSSASRPLGESPQPGCSDRLAADH